MIGLKSTFNNQKGFNFNFSSFVFYVTCLTKISVFKNTRRDTRPNVQYNTKPR